MTLYLFEEITALSALKVRQAIDSGEPITIWCNSPGGSVVDALSIYDSIVDRAVTVIATGQCESAALLVLLAGARRCATPHCRFMYHGVTADGDLSSADAGECDHLSCVVADIIRGRTGTLLSTLQKYYFGADTALTLNFIQEIR